MSGVRYARLSFPGPGNLGDAIQSLAAKRFVPRDSQHIARETISERQLDGQIKMILNGWFMHAHQFWPPHASIEPLLISMHFVEPGRPRIRRWHKSVRSLMLGGAGGDYLRRWGPVGARDLITLEALQAANIPAYHSGCLTLTLRSPDPHGQPAGIVACDVPGEALAQLTRLADGRDIKLTTHFLEQDLDVVTQEAAAADMLRVYARASVVVTTRIHAALPCLALGTPVLLLTQSPVPRRISDMAVLMHSCSISDFVRGRCNYDFAAPLPNPTKHIELAQQLVESCTAFTGLDACDLTVRP